MSRAAGLVRLLTAPAVLAAEGPRDADAAWERYARVDRWTGWAPQLRAVRADGARLRVGLVGTVHGPGGPGLPFTVTAVDEDARTWSWEVGPRVAGRRLRLHHGVAADGAGSRTWLRVDAPWPLTLPYLPVARLALHRLVR